MSNGKGLKGQWGVGDPAKAGSDRQSQQFQASFQREITVINRHLQYTSANADAARHDPLGTRRDALYPAFQSALAQIDRTNPSKAQPAIDKVLGEGKTLCSEAATLHKSAEKDLNAWKVRQPKYDVAVHQVEELEAWGDAKAAPLRGLVDGIREKTNQRLYAPANTTVDQLLPKLKPLYDDYLKQKAAKPKYEQTLAEQTARLDQLKAAERPSQPMTAKIGEADTALTEARAKADAKDYVGGLEQMKAVQTAIDALDKLAKDPQRAKFLAERKTVEEVFSATAPTLKTLETDWNALVQVRDQVDPAADSGDYAGACKLLADLKPKFEEYKKKLADLEQQKKDYDTALAGLKPQLDEALKSTYKPLKPTLDEITRVKGEMEANAQKEDFVAALQSLNDLKAKVEAFLPELKKLQQAEQDYTKARAALKPKLADALLQSKEYPAMKPARDAIVSDDGAVETAASAHDFERALQLVKALETKVDAYLAAAKTKADETQKKADEITKKLDDTGYFGRDNVAREEVAKLTQDDIRALPAPVRNRLLEELQEGNFSDDDKAACKKLFSELTLDPQYEKIDNANQQKMIDKMKNDPAFKKAREDWNKQPIDEAKRLAILKKAVDYQAEAYGIPLTSVEAYSPKNDDGSLRLSLYGEYDHDNGKLMISREMMTNQGFDQALDTAVHENGHRYQATLIDRLEGKKKPPIEPGDPLYNQAMTFKLNDTQRGYYVHPKKNPTDAPTPDRGDEYFVQPQENQSRRTGTAVTNAKIGQ
jgi:hypothetical protein